MSGYSDVIVMRHPEAGSVAEFAAASRVPVINGGDGPNEHPSQALLDLYTIQSEMESRGKGIDGLRIALVGDLKYGRAVHSLCKLLSLYDNVHYKLVSPVGLGVPENIKQELLSKGHEVEEYDQLEAGIHNADILYVTRTQEERFPTQEDADRYRGLFRLNNEIYTENCEPNTVIMHPLPRDSRSEARELDDDLFQNPNLAIFRQTDNGVLIRMALFALVLDVAGEVHNHAQPGHQPVYTAQAEFWGSLTPLSDAFDLRHPIFPGFWCRLVAAALRQEFGRFPPGLFRPQALHGELPDVGFAVGLHLNPEGRRRAAHQIDAAHAGGVLLVRGCIADPLAARLLLGFRPLLVQRLGVAADLSLLGLVEPDQAEVLLLELAVDAAGNPEKLPVVQFVNCHLNDSCLSAFRRLCSILEEKRPYRAASSSGNALKRSATRP